jgi:hypothetical protein
MNEYRNPGGFRLPPKYPVMIRGSQGAQPNPELPEYSPGERVYCPLHGCIVEILALPTFLDVPCMVRGQHIYHVALDGIGPARIVLGNELARIEGDHAQ